MALKEADRFRVAAGHELRSAWLQRRRRMSNAMHLHSLSRESPGGARKAVAVIRATGEIGQIQAIGIGPG